MSADVQLIQPPWVGVLALKFIPPPGTLFMLLMTSCVRKPAPANTHPPPLRAGRGGGEGVRQDTRTEYCTMRRYSVHKLAHTDRDIVLYTPRTSYCMYSIHVVSCHIYCVHFYTVQRTHATVADQLSSQQHPSTFSERERYR